MSVKNVGEIFEIDGFVYMRFKDERGWFFVEFTDWMDTGKAFKANDRKDELENIIYESKRVCYRPTNENVSVCGRKNPAILVYDARGCTCIDCMNTPEYKRYMGYPADYVFVETGKL